MIFLYLVTMVTFCAQVILKLLNTKQMLREYNSYTTS